MGNGLLCITGFFNVDTINIWPRKILVIGGREGCPVHCGIFNRSLASTHWMPVASPFKSWQLKVFLDNSKGPPDLGGMEKIIPSWDDLPIPLDNFPFFIHLGMLMFYYISIFLCVCCSNACFYFLTLENCSRNSSFKRSGPEREDLSASGVPV